MDRCSWVPDDRLYINYHDNEWGVPVHDDQVLFEFLVLESAQAGLSWITILRKRENYRKAYEGFDPRIVAKFDATKVEELMANSGIVRNRRKIESSINNAKLFIDIQKEYESFANFLWSYVDNQPIIGGWNKLEEVPVTTELSDRLSKDLKKRGFKFVGSTIMYSYLQAVGVVNDHTKNCFKYND